ncbi:MAG: hypothetical protein BWY48_00426 [Parcubacteria group bacterium ADurb.Bin305]|nr:MAG: hypothetical protein BWY48_00426 [Parcubacteria group bacterium ADurb.Bin305]
MKTLLKEPEIVDKVLLNYKSDERWLKYNYHLYCSSWFYENIVKFYKNIKYNKI